MTIKTYKSIFWMTGMIFAYELLASFLALILFIIIFSIIVLFSVMGKSEIGSDLFSTTKIFISLSALSCFAVLFGQFFGIRYGVRYVLSKALIQSNRVKIIVQWYVAAHLIFFIFFLQGNILLPLISFLLPSITGSFFILYFFKNTIDALKS